jgi:hypothetical protein
MIQLGNYNPSIWYWIVAGSTTLVWSSASMSYVPVTDATYVAWLTGNSATIIDTPQNLGDVLAQQVFPTVFARGANVTSTGTPALNGLYAMDADTQGNLTALSTGIAAGKPLPGGGTTFNYPDMSRAQHAFTGPQFLNLATAIESYIYVYEQAVAANLAGGSVAIPSNNLTIA